MASRAATEGTVRMESASDDRIVISGEQAFDIRDFALPSPTMLMLRIFPGCPGAPVRRGGAVSDED